MNVQLKPLNEQVMVITGATSGIGLATAQAAAQAGAKVVLAARTTDALRLVEAQIKNSGGEAVHVVADVAKRDDVERIAVLAQDRFGGFDTWVNNAGVSIFGRIDEISDEDHRQVFETNFWGLVYGSQVAARHFKHKGGAIINLGSLASDMAIPLQGMYSASKHAIKGFTDAFRMELEREGAPISVTLIKPTSIDTPFPQHAKNYTDRELKLPAPVYTPEEAAHAILHAAANPVRDVYIGGGSKLFSTLNKHLPRAMDWVGEQVLAGLQRRDEPPRNPEGTLTKGGSSGRVRGDHPGHVMNSSLYTRASLHPLAAAAVLGLVGIAATALFSRE